MLKSLRKCVVNFWQDRRERLKISNCENRKFVIGRSFLKKPISCYRVGSGTKKILYVSAMHGNEIGTVKLAYRLLDYLTKKENDFKDFVFFVIPCLNIDGFEKASNFIGYLKSGQGRQNANGVDLNRNFPTANFRSRSYVLSREVSKSKYKREISAEEFQKLNSNFSVGAKPKNCGQFGASEPEVEAIVDLFEKEKISLIFSFHNSGRDVMGGKNELSKKLVKIYAKETGYEILEDNEWQKIGQTGTMKDWCDEKNISFLEIEGSTRYGSDWDIQKPALEAILKYLSEKV